MESQGVRVRRLGECELKGLGDLSVAWDFELCRFETVRKKVKAFWGGVGNRINDDG